MSWVDTSKDERWSRFALENRAENELRGAFPDADHLRRKAHAMATGVGFMTADEKSRWEQYNAAQGQLAAQVEAEQVVMQRLEACFAVEAAQRELLLLPDDEEHAAARAAAQAVIDAAPPEVMAQVATRNRNSDPI